MGGEKERKFNGIIVKRNFTLHNYPMITGIRHKGLRLLWEEGNSNKLPADLVTRIEIIMDVIDSAQQVPQDFEAFRNWNLHKLSGDLKDYWSVKVNKNFRIVFRVDGLIAYIDYH